MIYNNSSNENIRFFLNSEPFVTKHDGRQVEDDLAKNIKRHYKMLKKRFKNVLKKTILNSLE